MVLKIIIIFIFLLLISKTFLTMSVLCSCFTFKRQLSSCCIIVSAYSLNIQHGRLPYRVLGWRVRWLFLVWSLFQGFFILLFFFCILVLILPSTTRLQAKKSYFLILYFVYRLNCLVQATVQMTKERKDEDDKDKQPLSDGGPQLVD